MKVLLNKHPYLLVATLCGTYGLLYLGRVNVSVVLPILAQDLGVGLAEVGALGTVFFWFYGLFQFVSGEVGSHFSPFRIVSLGLLATAIINLLFAFQSSLVVMLILVGDQWHRPIGRLVADGAHPGGTPRSAAHQARINPHALRLRHRHGPDLDPDRGSDSRWQLAQRLFASRHAAACGLGALVESGHRRADDQVKRRPLVGYRFRSAGHCLCSDCGGPGRFRAQWYAHLAAHLYSRYRIGCRGRGRHGGGAAAGDRDSGSCSWRIIACSAATKSSSPPC